MGGAVDWRRFASDLRTLWTRYLDYLDEFNNWKRYGFLHFTPIGYEWGAWGEADAANGAVGDFSEFAGFLSVADGYGVGPSYGNDEGLWGQTLERQASLVARLVRVVVATDGIVRIGRGYTLDGEGQADLDALVAALELVRSSLGGTFSSDAHKVPSGPLPPVFFVGE